MLHAGLTGGIASGKTFVSDRLGELGALIIDADIVARDVVKPGEPGLTALVEIFSNTILDADGHLDRAALRQIIFADDDARDTVNTLLHPLIRERSTALFEQARAAQAHPYVVQAIPLLVETEQQARFDRVVVVDCPREIQIERLMARDGGSREAAERILDSQATREQRLAAATDVINNSGSLTELKTQTDSLHERLLAASRCQ